MEFLEFLFEIIVDGAAEVADAKKAPFLLRILAAFICIAFVGIIIAIIYIEGYDYLMDSSISNAIVLFAFGSIVVMVFFYMIYRQFKTLNQKKEQTKTEQICEVKTSNLNIIRGICIALSLVIILGVGLIYIYN